MKKTIVAKLLGVAAVGLFGSVSEPAHAGQIATCTVQYVQVLNEQVVIKCTQSANEFYAWGWGWASCNSRVTSDTFKTFASVAQSALLSGKPLLMNYNDTDATCPVTQRAVTLVRISQ